jgi:predicted membrane channel-forming protein YqfA (hemolysin III family)
MTLADFEQNPLSYSAVNGTFPSWMSAFEYDASRIVIAGSTLMFTGRNLDYQNTDLKWFYMGDNARLFMNIIDWLSEDFVIAPSAILPLVIISSVVLVIGVVFYLIKKIR